MYGVPLKSKYAFLCHSISNVRYCVPLNPSGHSCVLMKSQYALLRTTEIPICVLACHWVSNLRYCVARKYKYAFLRTNKIPICVPACHWNPNMSDTLQIRLNSVWSFKSIFWFWATHWFIDRGQYFSSLLQFFSDGLHPKWYVVVVKLFV